MALSTFLSALTLAADFTDAAIENYCTDISEWQPLQFREFMLDFRQNILVLPLWTRETHSTRRSPYHHFPATIDIDPECPEQTQQRWPAHTGDEPPPPSNEG